MRALLALACLATHPAQTKFPRAFAPQEGLTAPIERPTRDEICLNGTWQFQPAPRDLPTPTSRWEETPIRIPSPWNVNAFPDDRGLGGDFRCYPSYPKAWERVEAGWLRRSFTIPATWHGKRFILRFNAVAGDTQILVNGKTVARNFDNFLPFEADVTGAVHAGQPNELLVGVRKGSLTDNPGPNGRRTYQGGSMWGQAIAGIWQDVFLTAVPRVHVTDTFVKPNVGRGELEVEVTIKNDTSKPATVTPNAEVRDWRNLAGKSTIDAPEPKWTLGRTTLQFKAGSTTIPPGGTASIILKAPVKGRLKTWTPTTPNLYGLVIHVGDDAKLTRFGWRETSFAGGKLLLNGKPIVLKGDSWHFLGIPQMTRRYAWAWFKTLHDAGLNAVRLHAQPYPAFYLDMADEMGIMVLDETAVWASDGGPKLDDPAYWHDTERHLGELILRDRNHPSVFGWSVSNEVMAVVRNVFHAPKSVEDEANRMNGVWLNICRKLDPTRPWVSADGEEDGRGTLPTYVIHYGDRSTMDHAIASGKPWGVGEAGPAYYGTPKQIADQAKDSRAYLSFADRIVGVAKVSYESLRDQREKGASYRSVFNLVWYGLQPLELGMADTTQPPALNDGITFGPFVEGRPGVQPERLGPYCTTLNPGYDPKLPLYRTWPLFDAIRDAQAEPPVEYKTPAVTETTIPSPAATIPAVRVLSDGGTLAQSLAELGAKIAQDAPLLVVDGAKPPAAEAKATIDQTLANGGTVLVWGADRATLSGLNALLPQRLDLTTRTASSLVATESPLTAGLTPASLYFSELSPSTILTDGLAGPLIEHATPLLTACNTDWKLWNGQPETTKTAMVLRSEREAKPSGVALAELKVGPGRLVVCNLPVKPATSQAESLNRTILRNLGLILGEGASQKNLLDADGTLSRALTLGTFPQKSLDEAQNAMIVWPDWQISAGQTVEGRTWKATDLSGIDGQPSSISYLSFWLYSPISLDNLLLDPHLPNLQAKFDGLTLAQLWVGTKSVKFDSGIASPLLLQLGWNHVLVKLIGPHKDFSLKLVSSQPAFQAQLRAALEKP